MPTVRDAVFSAMTLDIFNRHANKVVMANCAQLINCLNSLYLASEDNFVVTPVGHVFGMYAGHQGGASVRRIIFRSLVYLRPRCRENIFLAAERLGLTEGKYFF